jgi:hypothetical protein
VENSTNVRVLGNAAYNNTVGIFVDLLPTVVPGITSTNAANNLVAGNFVVNNNRANTADPMDIASAEESGVGILIVGGSHTTVEANVVTGNNTAGIAVLSGLDLIALGALQPGDYTGLDPNPEHTTVVFNFLAGNGNNPADPSQPHGNLIVSPYAQAGSDNHFRFNGFFF